MAGTNGSATAADYDFDAVPQTRTFRIRVLRGGKPTTIAVTGYHRDHPEVWNQIQAEAAWKTWRSVCVVANTDPETGALLDPPTKVVQDDTAEATLRKDMLLAVLEGLEEPDAAVLAAENGGWDQILTKLGWWDQPSASEAPAGPEDGGEGAPTGDASSPASPPSTASATKA